MEFGLILLTLVALFSTSWSKDLSLSYRKHANSQCVGADNSYDTDILRDFAGTAKECKGVCLALKGCVGFIRVNQGAAAHTGNCYFRSGPLQTPYETDGDDRDCYERLEFKRYPGKQCEGSEDDILRDFVGDVDDCIAECSKRKKCVGFVRVSTGIYAGKCYLRGGRLKRPRDYTGDERDCYKVISPQEGTSEWADEEGVIETFEMMVKHIGGMNVRDGAMLTGYNMMIVGGLLMLLVMIGVVYSFQKCKQKSANEYAPLMDMKV